MRPYTITLLTALFSFVGFTSDVRPIEPGTVYWEASQLVELRSPKHAPTVEQQLVLTRLRINAEQALKRGPYSVTYKKEIPPSGDKHDYMSFSRYWWPNPETEDGLPYIRKDGQVNVELRQRGDRDQIGLMFEDVETLALAAYLLDERKYAVHAVENIQTWFLNPKTKMNPHLRFGQSVPGRAEGRGVGIIDTRGFIKLLDAVEVLKAIGSIQTSDTDGLSEWFTQYLDWLRSSELGKDESGRENNHGSWYAAQVARIAVFVGQKRVARDTVQQVLNERIPAQFSRNGSQPAELQRTLSLHYSLFNLEALSVVARVGESLGIDVWNPSGSQGLKPGIDFVLPYVSKRMAWPHPQMKKYLLSRGACSLLRMASVRYESVDYIHPMTAAQIKYPESDYSSLQFRTRMSISSTSDQPLAEVKELGAPNLPVFRLPDISSYTVEAIRDLVPSVRSGKAEISHTKGEPILSETFRRERGEDLRQRQETQSTRVIKVTNGALTLTEVATQVGNENILSIEEGVAILRLPVLIDAGATLVIDGQETDEVRLSTDKGAFIANAGKLIIVDAKITSWEEKKDSPTHFKSKTEFRPFISSYIRSKTYLANSKFFHLGFHAPTAYGISLSSEPEREDPTNAHDWPTGQIIGNEFHGLYYGFYSYEARAVKIIGNKYTHCVLYGIDPHDRSTDLVIARNVAIGTIERHGIIGSRGINNSFIFDNVTHSNHGSGIMLDRECSGNVVANNRVYKNGQGIAIYESPSNIIAENVVVQNTKSGVRVRNSTNIDVFENRIVANGDYGVEISSKRLSDHKKRMQRGDSYNEVVSLRLCHNVIAGNRGGIMKGSNVDHLLLSDISMKADLPNLEAITGLKDIELYPTTDDFFGSQLKKSAEQLEKVFDETVKAIEYRNSSTR